MSNNDSRYTVEEITSKPLPSTVIDLTIPTQQIYLIPPKDMPPEQRQRVLELVNEIFNLANEYQPQITLMRDREPFDPNRPKTAEEGA